MPRHYWTAKDIALLGKLTDREVAVRLKRSRAGVTARRLRLGTAALNPEHETRRWSVAEEKFLGTRPDEELVGLLKRSRGAVHNLLTAALTAHYTQSEIVQKTSETGNLFVM